MLIQPPRSIELGDVVTLKLVTGQELIGKLAAQGTTFVTLHRPIEIGIQMMNATQASIGFNPFLASVSDDLSIRFDLSKLVVEPLPTRKDVAAQYIKATTGLVVPGDAPRSGLIGL